MYNIQRHLYLGKKYFCMYKYVSSAIDLFPPPPRLVAGYFINIAKHLTNKNQMAALMK